MHILILFFMFGVIAAIHSTTPLPPQSSDKPNAIDLIAPRRKWLRRKIAAFDSQFNYHI